MVPPSAAMHMYCATILGWPKKLGFLIGSGYIVCAVKQIFLAWFNMTIQEKETLTRVVKIQRRKLWVTKHLSEIIKLEKFEKKKLMIHIALQLNDFYNLLLIISEK